jgi:competence ComEA-like helix-hairpin-helix protein
MGLYTRQQLLLLLLLVAAAGAGLGVSHWRAAHPELVERLEQIDREAPPVVETIVERETAQPSEPMKPAAAARRRVAERPARTAVSPRPAKRSGTPDDEHHVPLDLNRATLVDLTQLPGVGPVLARRIIDARDAVGGFAAVEDLATVRGLGRSKLERLRPLVGVLE